MLRNRNLIMAAALGALAGAVATVAAAPELHLRGGRFHPLTYADLDPAQKEIADAALTTGRTSFDGPMNITLRSPEMSKLGAPLTPEAFRKTLQRARTKFLELLILELRETIHPAEAEDIEAEIYDLGLGHLYRRYSAGSDR